MDAAALTRLLGAWDAGPGPLYEQLSEALAALIGRGELAPGTRLPSERSLAGALDVSRGTVVAAYGRLREAEAIRSRRGSGSVVAGTTIPARGSGELQLDTLLGLNVTANVGSRDDLVNLLPACWQDTTGLPADLFEIDSGDVMGAGDGHGYHSAGLPELRVAVADYYCARGVPTSPAQILVTAGAHQAIDLITRMCVGPGDAVIAEQLTYPGARDVFRAAGARTVGVPIGPDGVRVEALARSIRDADPRLVYLVPTVHNPTTAVLPVEHRERIAELAASSSTVVIDDESLAETKLDGEPPPPLVSFADHPDALGRLLTVGSTSKSFWGGLRIGWVRGPEAVITHLTRLKTLADLASPVISQIVAERFMRRADEVLPARRAALAQRFGVLSDCLAHHLPDWSWEEPRGGLALWVTIPDTDALAFSRVAARHGVGVVPGSACAVDDGSLDHLRLGIGLEPARLEEGARRLRNAWAEHTGTADGGDVAEIIV